MSSPSPQLHPMSDQAQQAFDALVGRCIVLAADALKGHPFESEGGTPMVLCSVRPKDAKLVLVWESRTEEVASLDDDQELAVAVAQFLGVGYARMEMTSPEKLDDAVKRVEGGEAAIVVCITMDDPPVAACQLQPRPSGSPETLFGMMGAEEVAH